MSSHKPAIKNKTILYLISPVLMLIFIAIANTSQAANDLETQYLASVQSQLDVLSNLVLEAERQQDVNQRMVFDYLKLRQDIQTIQHGLLAYQDVTTAEPRAIAPIDGDYIDFRQAG